MQHSSITNSNENLITWEFIWSNLRKKMLSFWSQSNQNETDNEIDVCFGKFRETPTVQKLGQGQSPTER